MRMLILTALGAALPTAAALCQSPSWKIPERGAAEYERTWTSRSAVAPSVAAARQQEPTEPTPERYLPQRAPAPWLCHGELDPSRRSVRGRAADLRDVIRNVACDLAVGSSGSWSFPRLVPFGDLRVHGRVQPAGADGAQEMELRIERRQARAEEGDPRRGPTALAALCDRDCSGALRIRRVVDAELGVGRAFEARMTLFVDEGRRAVRRIDLQDDWRLVALRDNQDADFRKRVAAAVRGGAAWLLQELAGAMPHWLRDKPEERYTFGGGRLALAVLTLLHAEVDAGDPVLAAAIAELRRRKITDTYSLATGLMALSQLYAPPREAEMVRNGSLARRSRRTLPDGDRNLAQKWLDRLLDNRDTRVDPEETLRFDYDGGRRFDNSASQYGLLGLDAAALCGLDIAPSTWAASADHFLKAQCPARGAPQPFALVTHAELAASPGVDPQPRPWRAPARGFSYQDPEEPPYGSLTAASLAGMVVARAGMQTEPRAHRRRLRELDAAIEAGFGWIAREFTARHNPGFCAKNDKHWHYWLYSLERACELAGVAWIDGRDWHYEGALQLLSQQQKNGSFRADQAETMTVEATCFAVLFLKKSTLPAATGT